MKITGKDDLSFRDISGKVGDRMSLIIFRHGQDRDHGNGTGVPEPSSGTFIHRCKVGIKISGISASSGNFFLGGGNLTQRLCIVRDIRQDDQNVHSLIKCEIFCSRQRHTRCRDTLYGRIVCQVCENDGTVDRAGTPEIPDKEFGLLKCNTDRGEYYGEVLSVAQYPCLPRDLRRQVRMGKTGSRKDRKLLSSYKGVQAVNCRNAGLDKFRRVSTRGRVHRQAVDIPVIIGYDVRASVDRFAHSVEYTAEHILADAELQRMSEETHLAFRKVDSLSGLEKLYNGAASFDLKNLAASYASVRQLDLAEFVIGYAFYIIDDHQGAGDLFNRLVFSDHSSSPPA